MAVTQKKYICAFCARAFTRSEHKQRHERSHTNEKPFHCTSCSSSFVRRDLLQRHCRTVHSLLVDKRRKSEEIPTEFSQPEESLPLSANSSLSSQSLNNFKLGNIAFKAEHWNHDLIQLLSVLRKLQSILDPECFEHNLNDYFLIGYIKLSSATSTYKVFDKILKELMSYLNAFDEQSQHNQHEETSLNNFKIGIIYSIISLGYISNNDYRRSMWFFLKAWNLLIKKLIPNYNNNNNLFDQIEILNNLFVLSYIYLQQNLGKYEQQDTEDTTISDDVILNYLNDISYIINSNLISVSPSNLIELNMNLFWNIYILLSTYLKNQLPKIYSFFIHRQIHEQVLSTLMLKLLKMVVDFNEVSIELDAKFLKQVIIATLSNELKNSSNGTELLVFESKNALHNAIILVNKSVNTIYNTENAESTHTTKLFELFKKNLIINSPLKFHELLNNYLFIPSQFHNWELLNITLQEANMNFPMNRHLNDFILASLFVDITTPLGYFFQFKDNPMEINNNLSIISFPLIFFNNYLDLRLVSLQNFNLLQLKSINIFVFEWYLIMHKALLMTWNTPEVFDASYILQNLFFLLLDNKSVILRRLDIPEVGFQKPLDDEEFTFNQKWFWVLKLKIDSIFESWMDFIKCEVTTRFNTNNLDKSSWNNVSKLKVSVTKFIDELLPFELSKYDSVKVSHGNNQFMNYSVEYENQHKYKRANSITLGVLGTAKQQKNNHHIEFVQSPNSPTSTRNNSIHRPYNTSMNSMLPTQTQTGLSPNIRAANYYVPSYSYPPLPVLSTQNSSQSVNQPVQKSQAPPAGTVLQSQGNATFGDPYVLPPILGNNQVSNMRAEKSHH